MGLGLLCKFDRQTIGSVRALEGLSVVELHTRHLSLEEAAEVKFHQRVATAATSTGVGQGPYTSMPAFTVGRGSQRGNSKANPIVLSPNRTALSHLPEGRLGIWWGVALNTVSVGRR